MHLPQRGLRAPDLVGMLRVEHQPPTDADAGLLLDESVDVRGAPAAVEGSDSGRDFDDDGLVALIIGRVGEPDIEVAESWLVGVAVGTLLAFELDPEQVADDSDGPTLLALNRCQGVRRPFVPVLLADPLWHLKVPQVIEAHQLELAEDVGAVLEPVECSVALGRAPVEVLRVDTRRQEQCQEGCERQSRPIANVSQRRPLSIGATGP